jgi:hypothetical protein
LTNSAEHSSSARAKLPPSFRSLSQTTAPKRCSGTVDTGKRVTTMPRSRRSFASAALSVKASPEIFFLSPGRSKPGKETPSVSSPLFGRRACLLRHRVSRCPHRSRSPAFPASRATS